MTTTDLAHEIWAAAQLMPGEGIADGVGRIAEYLTEQEQAIRADERDRCFSRVHAIEVYIKPDPMRCSDRTRNGYEVKKLALEAIMAGGE